MANHESRRRSSDQRNLLYSEPSMWGVLVPIVVIVAAIAVVLIVLFTDVFAAGR